MNGTEPVLTIRQVRLDGSEVSSSLLRLGPDRFTISDHEGQREPFTAQDPLAAVKQRIPVAGENETHFDRPDPQVLPLDGLLDALSIDGEPADPDEWAQVGAKELWSLEDTALRWSTAHRMLIDGKPVYGIRAEAGQTVLVQADDPEAPHQSWRELLALHWDNADNAAVGMAGYGTDGLFLVRPGLLAVVASTDEEYQVTLEKFGLDVDLTDVVLNRIDRVAHRSVLLAALQTPPSGDDDEETGLSLTTSLGRDDFAAIINAVQGQ